MTRTIAPTTFVIVFATVFVLGIPPRAQAGQHSDEHRGCSNASLRAVSDSPPQERFSLFRPLSPALSLKSVGRPSTGEVIPTQPRR